MRVWDWICSIFGSGRKTAELIAALARSEAALTKRMDELSELHADLVRQVGIAQIAQNQANQQHEKQVSDLRAIVAQMDRQAKVKPAVAGNMAEIRRFMGDVD